VKISETDLDSQNYIRKDLYLDCDPNTANCDNR